MILRPTIQRLNFFLKRASSRFEGKTKGGTPAFHKRRKNLFKYIKELITPRHPMSHYDTRYLSPEWRAKYARTCVNP